jgi:hypothetical protein
MSVSAGQAVLSQLDQVSDLDKWSHMDQLPPYGPAIRSGQAVHLDKQRHQGKQSHQDKLSHLDRRSRFGQSSSGETIPTWTSPTAVFWSLLVTQEIHIFIDVLELLFIVVEQGP